MVSTSLPLLEISTEEQPFTQWDQEWDVLLQQV